MGLNKMDKKDLSGPIGCLINMKREFEDEMDKIISEESNKSMEEMERVAQNYNIAIDILEEAQDIMNYLDGGSVS